ncbi:GTP-binding protein [Desulfomonile tiedjei]|uniref:Putative GTPase, G3E family n=1 Tax=Desulfomonile tiedjei (strain ATCC 49306 / DSM 6799 / DCB-1) TaxID=706587 RepID=I4C214_DESTA|nr:GTP-binding protein [Desulfomonile tiedjei]AFM23605.1 putative GTPase, G3E family [Desulfomonile tiedjei DSM 6799]
MGQTPWLFFVGGFLGAGKTTAINGLSKLLAQKGTKVAAITNDQAAGLVDTFFLSGEGIPAEEVAGSCFCCNFDGLTEAIDHSVQKVEPEIILAEPVGSCTDIVATVIRPMQHLMRDKVSVFGYSVLVEPDRWKELRQGEDVPWSMKFLFDKQIEEADIVVITKIDTLTHEELTKIRSDFESRYPHVKVFPVSARTGSGMEEWLNFVQNSVPGDRWLKEIDYQKYAEAEAEMGWLNAQATLKFPIPVDGKAVTGKIVEEIRNEVARRGGRVGHLKLLAVARTGSIKAGITVSGEHLEVDGTFTGPLSELQLTVNIRAAVSPGDLSETVNSTLTLIKNSDNAEVDLSYVNTFRPSPPNPTHRYST